MKVIILAAGEGIRMRPLSLTTPKPLLMYQGKTNLDHLFKHLPEDITGCILTVDYFAEKIKEYCKESFHGRTVRYVEGSKQGNAFGFMKAKEFISPGERFAVAYGDEVFVGDELSRSIVPTFSWLCYETPRPQECGIAVVDEKGRIIKVLEKPENPPSNLAADGFMVMNSDIFDYPLIPHANGECYLSDLMNQFVQDHEVVSVLASSGHTQLTDPSDIERLNKMSYSGGL